MKHKFLNCDRVLCLSAHPDDAEYGMLGSWIQHGDTFFDVVVLSTGGDFDGSSGNSRLKECENIWDKFSNVKGQFADCGHLKDKPEDYWVNYIETNFNVVHYDAILSLPKRDSHFEHRMVNNISYALLRGVNAGLITYRTPSTLEEWIPNFYVEVDELLLDEKIRVLTENFESQKDKLYFQEKSIKDFHTNYLCSKVGVGYVEQFKVERLYG